MLTTQTGGHQLLLCYSTMLISVLAMEQSGAGYRIDHSMPPRFTRLSCSEMSNYLELHQAISDLFESLGERLQGVHNYQFVNLDIFLSELLEDARNRGLASPDPSIFYFIIFSSFRRNMTDNCPTGSGGATVTARTQSPKAE
ncbi:MAG: hypothetical protein IJ523_10845 [Succinivibrionaceae bacterium]|nr:hypothetical protein [Succinivibrionaceae bacterium]